MKEISKTDARNFGLLYDHLSLMFSSPIDSNHVFPSLNQQSQDVHKSFSRARKKSMQQPQSVFVCISCTLTYKERLTFQFQCNLKLPLGDVSMNFEFSMKNLAIRKEA